MTQHDPVARRGHLHDDPGFTLVEILIAIVLVGILSAVAVIGVGTLTSKAKASVCSAERDTLTTAAKIYLTENLATEIPSDAKAGVTPMDTLRQAGLISANSRLYNVNPDGSLSPIVGNPNGCKADGPPGPGSISGLVVDSSGKPLSGICVNVDGGQGAQSDGDGRFSFAKLIPGSYKLQFSDCTKTPMFVSQWYPDQASSDTADDVVVNDSAETTVADVVMRAGVSVTGTVTDSDNTPLAGVNVNVNSVGNGWSTGTQTDSSGTYRTGPVPSGQYRVQFNDQTPERSLAAQYWNDQISWNQATVLTLSSSDGPVHGDVNAVLAAGGSVSGTVTGPDAQGLGGICVNADIPSNGGWEQIANGATTAADGTYTLAGIPATQVRIEFRDCNSAGRYSGGWYPTAASFDTATPLDVNAGQTITGIDTRLAVGISVSGKVTDAKGKPIKGINVNVNPTGDGSSGWAQTSADGTYKTSPVPPGTYRVEFSAQYPSPKWASVYWNNQFSWNSATTVTLNDADAPTLGGINATLLTSATVTGTVTSPAGGAVAGICVSANTDGANGPDQISAASTGSDGSYVLDGLPATAVKIRFEDCNGVGPYVQGWWQTGNDAQSATVINLRAGQHVKAVDFQMAAAASLTGTVTDSTGAALEGICVQATTKDFVGGLTRTGVDGSYSLDVDRAGDYDVQFVDCSNTKYAGQFWKGQPDDSTATPVTLVPGQIVSGIDATLTQGATASLSGRLTNAAGTAMTAACAVAYLPNQYAVIAAVNADGTYTIGDIPSGTYALAFLGCTDGDPDGTVKDPTTPALTYTGVWWNNVPLDIKNGGDGGPDPIAEHAELVTISAGKTLTGYDHCFGCTTQPPP